MGLAPVGRVNVLPLLIDGQQTRDKKDRVRESNYNN